MLAAPRASSLPFHAMALAMATMVGGDANSTSTTPLILPTSTFTTMMSTTDGLDSCGGVTRCLNDTQCARCLSAINMTRSFVHTEAQFLNMRESVDEVRLYEVGFFETLLSNTSCSTNATLPAILFPALLELGTSLCVDAHGMYTDTCSIAEYVFSSDDS